MRAICVVVVAVVVGAVGPAAAQEVNPWLSFVGGARATGDPPFASERVCLNPGFHVLAVTVPRRTKVAVAQAEAERVVFGDTEFGRYQARQCAQEENPRPDLYRLRASSAAAVGCGLSCLLHPMEPLYRRHISRKSCDFAPFLKPKSVPARSLKASKTAGGTHTWIGIVFSAAGRRSAAIGRFVAPRAGGRPLRRWAVVLIGLLPVRGRPRRERGRQRGGRAARLAG